MVKSFVTIHDDDDYDYDDYDCGDRRMVVACEKVRIIFAWLYFTWKRSWIDFYKPYNLSLR